MIKEAINKIIDMATGHIIKDDFGRQVWDKTGAIINDPRLGSGWRERQAAKIQKRADVSGVAERHQVVRLLSYSG